jgi:hypothetical protein
MNKRTKEQMANKQVNKKKKQITNGIMDKRTKEQMGK